MAVSATAPAGRARPVSGPLLPAPRATLGGPVRTVRSSQDDAVATPRAALDDTETRNLELLPQDRAFRLRDGTVLSVPRTRAELRYGSSDRDGVMTLQSLLVATGSTLEINGDFDRATQAALTDFQGRHDLTTTGIADAATWQTLVYSVFPDSFMVASTETVSLASHSADDYASLGDPVLRLGDRSDAVELLQTALATLGFAVDVDGIFGGGTDHTVRDFQSRFNASHSPTDIDGIVGPNTGERVRTALAWQDSNPGELWAEVNTAGALLPTTGTPPIERSVGPGGANRSSDVRLLQERLIDLGYLRGEADGQIGPMTFGALALATGVVTGATNPVSRTLSPSSLTAKRLWSPAMPRWVKVHQDNDGHSYGTSFTDEVVQRAERTYDTIRPSGVRVDLPLGDLSLIGGPTPDHKSHGTGFDLDVRMLQPDGYSTGSTVAGGHTDGNAAVLASLLAQPEVGRVLVDWRHSAFRERVRHYLELAGTPEAISKIVNEPSLHYHHLHVDFVFAPFGHSVR